MTFPLRRTLLLGLGLMVVIAVVPAGWWLDRTITTALEERVKEDLALAPMRLERQNEARADALMMHAQEFAGIPGLAAAVARGDRASAEEIVAANPVRSGEVPIVVGDDGTPWIGPVPTEGLLAGIRRGESSVGFVSDLPGIGAASLAPLRLAGNGVGAVPRSPTAPDSTTARAAEGDPTPGDGGSFREVVGAAGVAAPLDETAVATLSGIAAAEVVVADSSGGLLVSTLDAPIATAIASARTSAAPGEKPPIQEVVVGERRYWTVTIPLGEAATATFAVDVAEELAVLPRLRRGALIGAGAATLLALVFGSLLAAVVSRRVGSLAAAADRLAEGDFDAPLPPSRLAEVRRVSRAFERMRRALDVRIRDLADAYQTIEERESRLRALQSEMIQRDRLAAAGRLVTELAHEIRNPVANVRNCVEVVRRSLPESSEARDFADLAIEELLRMHELAERVLDLNRPGDPTASSCDPGVVVRRLAEVLHAGEQGERWPIRVSGEVSSRAAISPEVLKQVLMGLVQNAREASPEGGAVEFLLDEAEGGAVSIAVRDQGPGIRADVLPRIFDPFFTTKREANGVGLGLFIAEGLIRRAGGRLTASNREDGGGAEIVVELRPAEGSAGDPPETAGEEG